MIRKNHFITIMFFCILPVCFLQAQPYFNEHILRLAGMNCDAGVAVEACDADGDGDIDIFFTSETDTFLGCFINDGEGNFTEKYIGGNICHVDALTSVDMEMDGDYDILVSGWNENRIILFTNDGTGNFTRSLVTQWDGFTCYLSAADIDSDGDVDVFSGRWDSRQLIWHKNDGTGNFEKEYIMPWHMGGPSTYNIEFADLNEDNRLDIIYGLGNRIAWFRNIDNSTFVEDTISTEAAGQIDVVDLDQDGDMDILTTSMHWLENTGNMNFVLHQIDGSGEVMNINAVDIDGDNDLDIVTSSYENVKTNWLENNGDQSFTEHMTEICIIPNISFADFNNDSRCDIVAAFRWRSIAWYSNDDTILFVEEEEEEEEDGPWNFVLYFNYPNPFNPETTLSFSLPEKSHANLTVYNALGEKVSDVVNCEMDAGHHELKFDASGFSSGSYIYELRAGNFRDVKKMLLLK